MSRTYRVLGSKRVADGCAQTMRGLDRCPPWWWRRARATKPLRALGRSAARAAMAHGGDDDSAASLPVRWGMPWFT